MFTLSDADSLAINTVGPNYSINYEAEALDSYERTGDDLMDELESRAEDFILEASAYTAREDLGGITVYLRGSTLVAFYDYERFVGHVF